MLCVEVVANQQYVLVCCWLIDSYFGAAWINVLIHLHYLLVNHLQAPAEGLVLMEAGMAKKIVGRVSDRWCQCLNNCFGISCLLYFSDVAHLLLPIPLNRILLYLPTR